jgi:3-deoxy-7-phosphoheptulonate synthase
VRPIVDICKKRNIPFFRAQLFKPRTSPKSFQGLGAEGLDIINYLLGQGLQLVSEASSLEQLKIVGSFARIIQIGARNMQNFEFLKRVGKEVDFSRTESTPFVMLKRGFQNTLEEWLASAQYLEQSGVPASQIILCERGTRNFASPTGVTLDLALAYQAKINTPYHVIVDPSHGTRLSTLVLPMAKAILAMDFDGLMLEIHPRPSESLSDAQQAVSLEDFDSFCDSIDLTPFISLPSWVKEKDTGNYGSSAFR